MKRILIFCLMVLFVCAGYFATRNKKPVANSPSFTFTAAEVDSGWMSPNTLAVAFVAAHGKHYASASMLFETTKEPKACGVLEVDFSQRPLRYGLIDCNGKLTLHDVTKKQFYRGAAEAIVLIAESAQENERNATKAREQAEQIRNQSCDSRVRLAKLEP